MLNHGLDHPVIPLHHVFKGMADKYIENKLMRSAFVILSYLWVFFSRTNKHQRKINRDLLANQDLISSVLSNKSASIIAPQFSASFLAENPDEADQLKQTAKVIVSALIFREKLLNSELKPQHEVGLALDMQRYAYLFSRIKLLVSVGEEKCFKMMSVNPSDYIIVAIDGAYYKLTVFKNNLILSVDQIYNQLMHMMEDSDVQHQDEHQYLDFGLCSLGADAGTQDIFFKMEEKDPYALAMMNHALFFIAIDKQKNLRTLEQAARSIHVNYFNNRDYRRSMQLVVNSKAQIGLVVDPHAGIGGALSSYFLSELIEGCKTLDLSKIIDNKNEMNVYYERLHFNVMMNEKHQKQLNQLMNINQVDQDIPTVFHLENIGKYHFKKHGVNPEAAFHIAIHLAYKRYFKKIPRIGSYVNLQCLRYGHICQYNSTTAEMIRFLEEPTIEHFHQAVQQHKKRVKQIKQGEDEIYQCLNMLRMMLVQGYLSEFKYKLIGMLIKSSINDFNKRFLDPDMRVSSIPTFPSLLMAGRPGVVHPWVNTKLAAHYMIFENHMVLCFTSSYYQKEDKVIAEFSSLLGNCLSEIQGMLERHDIESSS